MSITKGFEDRRVSAPMEEWSEHGTYKYWGDDIERLLKHARALEDVLRRIKSLFFLESLQFGLSPDLAKARDIVDDVLSDIEVGL